ncbi:MAG: tetratricopeptide repeat protein [Armatimonadetes bacterium]|nr:tetratricopeptide repeat protein [Armatimonadota bacterium]
MGKPISSHIHLKLCILVVIITAVAFAQVVGHKFVSYDDSKYVTLNPHIRNGITLTTIAWAFTTFRASNWHPLTWLSHALDCQLYGLHNACGHHVTNLLLHLANVALLFFLFSKMTGAVWQSAFLAILFGVHPLHVESVAWVAERKDVLSTLFWMLTIFAYIQYSQSPKTKTYISVITFFTLGLMSKPMLVTLPFVLLLLDYWPLKRMNIGPPSKSSSKITKLVLEKVPLFILAACSSAMTFIAQRIGGSVATVESFTVGVRVANALVSYVKYLVKTIWPHNLAAFYPHPNNTIPTWQVFGSWIIILAITISVFKVIKKRPYLMVGWLWYLVTLIPVIGFIQVGFQAMADRYTYIPLIGIFIIIAWGVPDLVGRVGASRIKQDSTISPSSRSTILPFASSLVTLTLVILTWHQVRYWKDTITLFEHAIAVTKGNYVAHNNLGQELSSIGELDKAIAHYRLAIKSDPDPGLAYNNLGAALAQLGRISEAMEVFHRAVESDPECCEAYVNLGRGYSLQGDLIKAKQNLEKALEIDPENSAAYLEMGNVLGRQGMYAKAEEYFAKAIYLNPNSAEAHSNMGVIYRKTNRLDKAIAEFREAIRLKPDLPAPYHNLAFIYYTRGDIKTAWDVIQEGEANGVNPNPMLVQALSRAMPKPSLTAQPPP